MTMKASDEFQRNLKIIHVQPSASADCSRKRGRSPSTEPICRSPDSSPGKAQDENQNPVKVRCRPALDRAMAVIRNRGRDQHQCHFCGTVFPNIKELEDHRKFPHSYTCDECPRRFATRSELHRHYLHPEGLAISSPDSSSKIKAKESADKIEIQSSTSTWSITEAVDIKRVIFGKVTSKCNVLPQDSPDPPSSPFLDPASAHNSHDQDSLSPPGFLQSSNAEKKKHGDQDLKLSSEDSDSDSSSFLPKTPLPRHQIDKKEERDDSDSSTFLSKSPLLTPQIENEEGDSDDSESGAISSKGFLPKSRLLSPKIEYEELDDPPSIEPKMEPQDQNQNQANDGVVTDKCIECGVPIRKSNYASSSSKVLKCFQCQPQIFFRTQCPICEEEVDTVNIQYHLEHAHHDVFVVPCKICGQMMRKHDIIPHLKICGENGAKVLCPLCKKDMLKTSLPLHLQTHSNRPKQQCPHCDSQVLDLKGHIKRKHSGI